MSGPKRIGSIINQLLARRGYAQLQTVNQLAEAFKAAVGASLADHVQTGNIRRGVLEVVVRDGSTMQELAFVKKKILQKLLETSPESKITDIKFRLGKF
jgi:predicted nucleic acid-binding Zn ribbon protein